MIARGLVNLRQAEDFLADLGLGAHRALGLGRGSPCDTTLYRLLAEQCPAGFEETVFAQVKNLIARKVVKNDRLKLGVMSFDGKGTWSLPSCSGRTTPSLARRAGRPSRR